jgi:tRNA(fMet)-specific endonuclease VapC
MNHPLYLLDTNVVLALVRGKDLGQFIEGRFEVTTGKRRSLISVVTRGEIRVMAGYHAWGPSKLEALQRALDSLVTVDINVEAVIDAYVTIDLYSQRHPDGARNLGKNDLWIAACAKAAGATLLTTDQDFEHLSTSVVSVEYIDPRSKMPS